MTCQREELGYEEWVCSNDGYSEQQYHSCRHRSCPRCHASQTHQWLERTQARLLPCDHYHIVFTLPHELNLIWQYNRKWCSDHLFKASAETLKQLLADKRHLGAEVGILSSLHTWGRTLSFHPHIHLLVSGGGLFQQQWKPVKNDFLLPVGIIKAKFRGKWLSWLNEAYDKGELKLPAHWLDSDWRRVLTAVARKNWNVRIQAGYRHGKGVINYLSRYIRGGPIKDYRLLAANDNTVTFRYLDHRDSKEKEMSLDTEHFMTRVLWHVPVKGLHNVRYYGLYVPGARQKRNHIREKLNITPEVRPEKAPLKPHHCRKCGLTMRLQISVQRTFSYIKSIHYSGHGGKVQQGVEADRKRASDHRKHYPDRLSMGFFGPCGGSLT